MRVSENVTRAEAEVALLWRKERISQEARMPERRYRFFFDCRRDRCEVISIDYDIAIAARTLDEAKALLKAGVLSYIEDASKLPEPARSRLLNRRIPWAVRLQWMLRIFWSRINIIGDESSRVGRTGVACQV